MTSPGTLTQLLRQWLDQTPDATAAAAELIRRAGATGTPPSKQSFDADDPRAAALRELLPERFVSRQSWGRRLAFAIPAFETAQGIQAGAIVETLAELLQQPIENRRRQREERGALLRGCIEPHLERGGLAAAVAREELASIQAARGRLWSFAADRPGHEVAREVDCYWRLLEKLEQLSGTTEVRRAVHLGREIAGDTHWLRPGTRPWLWAASDLARHLPEMPQPSDALDGPAWCNAVLQLCGVAESLTSVRVLLFGALRLRGLDFTWSWPAEAAGQRMPVWLSASHLQRATLHADPTVSRIITVENETSFWDLLEQQGEHPGTALVYTEGHANRAVIMALRQLAAARPDLQFLHQGDLDLPGVRILHSLRQRTGIDIQADRMDPATLIAHADRGIPLSESEKNDLARELGQGTLPLRDLLAELLQQGRRLEQETLTGG